MKELQEGQEYIKPDFSNLSNNKKRSKQKEFNEFSKVTDLVRKYKASNKESDLLDILENLSGITNTYTLLLAPGNPNQQIYITPYMKKFLGMFLTPEERANANIKAYTQALARVRWITREYSYEDIYAKILEILIHTVKSMKIIGTCDCIYYIQLIVRYKLHDFVLKQTKDVITNIINIPQFCHGDEQDDPDEILERMSNEVNRVDNEDIMISNMYLESDISMLQRTDDVFKCLGRYEKYLLYLKDVMMLTNRQIITILKFEDKEELEERFDDIKYKLELLASS